MEIKIKPALTMNEIGGKANQEDCIFPYEGVLTSLGLPADIKCFVLCDGMGGHENGEVAAGIVSSTLQPAMLDAADSPDVMTDERFETALKKTYAELDKMEVVRGKRPGTTMTCLYLGENGVFVAHIGDSRIYQVRPGSGIIFRTSDHSLVNELVKAGELTEEEAAHHPRRNVILRAMQPGLEIPYRADTALLTDVKAGDYFFMCTDGVLENLSDDMLVDILSKNISDEEKNNEIFNVCYGRTRDNFSSILIPVASVTGEPVPTPEHIIEVRTVESAADDTVAPSRRVDVGLEPDTDDTVAAVRATAPKNPAKAAVPQTINKLSKHRQWIIVAIAVIIAVAATIFICMAVMDDKKDKPGDEGTRQEQPEQPEPVKPRDDTDNKDILPVNPGPSDATPDRDVIGEQVDEIIDYISNPTDVEPRTAEGEPKVPHSSSPLPSMKPSRVR